MGVLNDYMGQRVEIRRDSRRGCWSVFSSGDDLLVDRTDAIMLMEVSLFVTPARAIEALTRNIRNNASYGLRGRLIDTPPEGWFTYGLTAVEYIPTRATTWVYKGLGAEVDRAPFARLDSDGSVMVRRETTPSSFSALTVGRALSDTSRRQLTGLLQARGADWCLTENQPLRAENWLYEYGIDHPLYAIFPNGNPWKDSPLFFEKAADLREWVKTAPKDSVRLLPSRPKGKPKLPEALPPPKVLAMPFDMVGFYKERVKRVGFVFHPGPQPFDYLGNGQMVYVVVRPNSTEKDPWKDYIFKTREDLEHWLELTEKMLEPSDK